MVEIVGVRFKQVGKIYYFDPIGLKFEQEDGVIVETVRGVEYGMIAVANRSVEDTAIISPLKPVIRKATAEDTARVQENLAKEKSGFEICSEKIAKHGLNMKLIDVELTFDCGKILFYFTADGRVDFRELVKDLAAVFRTRIELRQIGVRDEAKMLGGIGVCGRPLCCYSYLGEFMPVSIKMAKEQGLSLNPAKISGTCGRLMCCLKYEHEHYEEVYRKMPAIGSIVETKNGRGTVWNISVLKGIVKVHIDTDDNGAVREYPPEEVTIIKRAEQKIEEEIAIPDLKVLEGD